MSVISKVIDAVVENGNRVIKLLRFGENDIVNTYLYSSFGDDFNPPKGYKALYMKTSNSNEPVCIGFVNKVIIDDLNPGEKQLSSTNEAGDAIAAYVRLLNDGIMHFNGDADFVAGFNDLKSGFDTLTDDLNSLISAYNSHIHITTATVGATPTPGVIAPTTSAGTPSAASIDASKKENIKTE